MLSETEGTHQNDISTSKPHFTHCDDKKNPKRNHGMTILN